VDDPGDHRHPAGRIYYLCLHGGYREHHAIRVYVESLVDEGKEGAEPSKSTWVSATLPLAQKDYLQTGMLLRLGGETGRIDWIGTTADSESVNILFDMDHDYFPLPTGEYDAVLVLETTTPISFLWN
jgi:hypothetical protein